VGSRLGRPTKTLDRSTRQDASKCNGVGGEFGEDKRKYELEPYLSMPSKYSEILMGLYFLC